MFKRKTVFIIGAGGSEELGLPMGEELKNLIGTAVTFNLKDGYNPSGGDNDIYWAIKALAQENNIRDTNPWWAAGKSIKSAMPQAISIDNYLHTHSDDDKIVLMGKLGIAVSILAAERASPLKIVDHVERLDFTKLKNSWHTTFMKMLFESVQKGSMSNPFENISFITFNYDRCIERYFEQALQNYLLITANEAQEMMKSLTIIHPYGQVGRLLWQSGGSVQFGAQPHHSQLIGIANQIRTFTERVEDEAVMAQIEYRLAQAEQIIFLGFSYGEMNLELLSLANRTAPGKLPGKKILGTSLGISPQNREVIINDLLDILRTTDSSVDQVDIEPTPCDGILQSYWRQIVR